MLGNKERLIWMATQQDVIKTFVKALGSDGIGLLLLDAAVKASSEGRFSSWEDLRESYISAVKTYGGTTETEQKAFLKKYCGIDLDDKDTGSITGSSAGGLLGKTAESIVENTSSESSYPTEALTISSTEHYAIHWPEQSGLTLTQQKIAGRMYHDWIPNSLQLIKESLGIESKNRIEVGFTEGYIGGKIPIYYQTSGSYYYNTHSNSGYTSLNPVIYVNTDNYDSVILTDLNGKYHYDSNNYMDRMIAHALAHKVLLENYNKARSLPEAVIEGLVDLVTGIDDLKEYSLLSCAHKDLAERSFSPLIQKEDVNGNLYISYSNSHNAGDGLNAYVLLRYLAKQTATTNMQRTIPVGTSYDAQKNTIIAKNTFTGTIDARLAETTVTSINAAATTKAVSLRGNTTNNVLRAGSGGCTLRGDMGDDQLYGGKGKDTFIYADGDGADTVYNYESGKDVISLLSGNVTKTTVSGADVIFSINKGSIRIKDGALKNIVLVDAQGQQSTKKLYYNLPSTASYNANKTVITLKAAASGTIDLAHYIPTVTTVNAKAVNKSINIYGNAKANVIYAGKGGANIRGKAGNDQLYGGNGKDTFIYADGDGADTIYNYESGKDILKLLSGKVTKMAVSGADVVFTVNKGSIRVKNGVLKNIVLIDAQGQQSTKKLYYNLPATASYNANKTAITLKAAASGTIDLAHYVPTVTTVNAKVVNKSINIYGNAKANVIYAGKGGANIRGKAGNDQLYGGNGKDTFIYADGDGADTIYNYESGKDILKLLSGKVTKTTVSGSDVVFTVNKGSIRVKNGVLKNIVLVDAQGKKTTKKFYYNLPSTASYNANKTTITLKAAASGTIDLANYVPSVTIVNAKAVKKSLNIYGNAKANVLYAGKNGGNIRGRAGADKIYCGAGTDKIWFGKGDGQDQVMSSSKQDIAYFYGIKDIKQITAKKSGSVMKLGVKGTKDVLSITGWTSSAGLNTLQLSNGVKYRLNANGTFKKI